MHIFAENASLYWDAGLPVIPLKRWNSPAAGAGKAPMLKEWTGYADQMPTEAMRRHWEREYPDSNIGLPFGPSSGLCAIDIDTEDQALVTAIRAALPHSPWVRIGQKGMGLIYRWHGQANFKLRNDKNESIVEFLGKGNQMVMPPSIHPKTERPYVSDTNLWEVLDKIQPLPVDIERVLRAALEPVLGVKGFTLAQTGRSKPLDVVPQGERDIQMVRHAGYLARVVLGIDKNAKFTLAEAIKHMAHWVEAFTATSVGDDMDPEKGVAKLVEFLLKDVEGGRTLPNGWDAGLTDDQLAHPAIAEMAKKNEVQRWTIDKAHKWLQAQLQTKVDDANWAMDKVTELIQEVAKDENFGELDFKTLAGKMKSETAGLLPLAKGDLVAEFKKARKGDSDMASDHEEIARAMVEELTREGELKHDQGRFWQWSGSCFNMRDDLEITRVIAERIKGNPLARRHSDYTAITKTVAMITRSPLGGELEEGINFANGFLDTQLVLHDHSPKYGKTFTMPFDYIPERANEAHKWLGFLESCWGDDVDYADKVAALQEAFAATMFGLATQYQRAFLLHGKPATGKTQALEVLMAMMPPTAQSSVPPTLWNERFQLANMIGKTLNVCGELPEEAVISGMKFKQIIGGEKIPTEFKNQDAIEFRPIAAQWFASNFLPRTRDTSGGFTRRWLIFDFNRIVPPSERIVDFHQMLVAEEREAIAAWAVQGLQRLQQQREYTMPASHEIRLNQVLRSNNSVAAFLQSSERVRPVDDKNVKADLRNVFDHYVDYMRNVAKGWSVSYERFRDMMNDLGHECTEYHDRADGATRYETAGIKLTSVLLPGARTVG